MTSLTPHQSALIAYELTQRRASDDLEKFIGALLDAQVDLNPHQVQAALFAFQSPLSKGAILADEVGLGKTIEAGLVISQRWAERKRRILVIAPANLRKQWFQELSEKFFLPCEILESKSYNAAIRSGNFAPFESSCVLIVSYQFASSKAADLQRTPWNLVVMDEAHRLRNVYKASNVIGNTLKNALEGVPKILLTATPLQNSLLELYGLVSIVDERVFGDVGSFREQYGNLAETGKFEQLRERLRAVCHRTLRAHVMPYIKYTKRHALLEGFTPHDDEIELYNMVTEYLSRDNLVALPNSQRTLLTLVLRKLLASSSFAIAGALETMRARLQKRLDRQAVPDLVEAFDQDFEALDETAEEWTEGSADEAISDTERMALEQEIADLQRFRDLAKSIDQNAKGKALLKALEVAFKQANEFGADRKALIFTESKRTQSYLLRLLENTPYGEGIVLFNGSNTDPASNQIYKRWQERHKNTDRITGSRSADMRSALVDEFRERGQVMIATEAGAEGINLQFCSLVVNYDLPWNPQRIEQRIGRCHRYGQKHDVVVVNFLNQKNAADQRVFELLNDKFKLFEGVFGVSDEVLGAIESGVDFEKRVAEIYQRCRQPAEIQTAFDELQAALSMEIDAAMTNTRATLLEHFDEEVNQKLKLNQQRSEEGRGRFEQLLLKLTEFEIGANAELHRGELGQLSSFTLREIPSGTNPTEIPLGRYELPRRNPEAHLYRLAHPLAQHLIETAKTRTLEMAELEFDYAAYQGKISVLEQRRGQSGWLRLSLYSLSALTQTEEHHLIAAINESGDVIDVTSARDLLKLPAKTVQMTALDAPATLDTITVAQRNAINKHINERNAQFFENEAQRLDDWAEDLKLGLERDLKDIDRQIKEARRAKTVALTLEEKLEGEKRVKALEALRSQKRRALFEAQDEIDAQRGKLIEELEGKLQQDASLKTIFTIRWRLV
jgi:ERCC4-related helicase